MNWDIVHNAFEVLGEERDISYHESFELAKQCACMLRLEGWEKIGRDIVIRCLDVKDRFPSETESMWNDLVEVSGLYPYVDSEGLSGASLLRLEYHKSPNLEGIYFHSEQAIIASKLRSKRSVIASAPTSFGKSLIIDEVIASGLYRNVVIIQPTLALLDETRKRFKKFSSEYNIIVSTSQSPSDLKSNIFLFTAERVVEYENFPAVEFFVIDEFYKLSIDRDDDRSIVLNQAFYKLLKLTRSFYLLGPCIKSVPSEIDSGVSYDWFPSDFATVATEEIALAKSMRNNTEEKRQILFETLDRLSDQIIVYCAAPPGATNLAVHYGEWLDRNGSSSLGIQSIDVDSMREWISTNIDKNWCLNALLAKGIGVHHGALPRHLSSSIVDAFNAREVRVLFCTSTLIEGVNTSAKHIILYDKKKGAKPIDYFDFRNIAGRSGRMRQHYIGHVYKFEEAPEQLDMHVDFPILTQIDAPPELLMIVDDGDLKSVGKEKIQAYQGLPEDLKSIIKKNPSFPIEGQLKIAELIEKNADDWHDLLSWRSFPTYQQLLKVLDLGWNNLRKPKESKGGVVSAAQLATMALQYSRFKTLKGLINNQINSDFWQEREPDYQRRVDTVVFQVLAVSRNWFDYKLPAMLSAISSIQKYVFSKLNRSSGDYAGFGGQVESGFLDRRLSDLGEYGIPRSAISKISRISTGDMSVEEVLLRLRGINIADLGLTDYEMKKVIQAL